MQNREDFGHRYIPSKMARNGSGTGNGVTFQASAAAYTFYTYKPFCWIAKCFICKELRWFLFLLKKKIRLFEIVLDKIVEKIFSCILKEE